MLDSGEYLRNQLTRQILGGNAFQKVEQVLDLMAYEQIGEKIYGLPYSFWQQLEHMRITQKDILDFSTNPDYRELNWPRDYWPASPAPQSMEQWESAKEEFFRDRQAVVDLILDPRNDLFKPFAHGSGQTLLREGLLVLEHNAYHTGQLFIIHRLITEQLDNEHRSSP